MKITAVRAHPLSIPLSQSLWTAQEALKDSSLVLVEVEAGQGMTGYGIIHGSPLKAVAEWVVKFGELIRGDDALAHEIKRPSLHLGELERFAAAAIEQPHLVALRLARTR